MFRGFRKKGKGEDEEAEKPLEDEQLIDDEDDDEWGDLEYEEDEMPLGTRKERILRGVRQFALSVGVLTVLAVGAGAVYVWYMGQYSAPDSASFAPQPTTTVKKETKRTRDPNAPFGASLQMLDTPVLPGSNAGISVKSVEGVMCTIEVEINKVPLKDSGLFERPTDEYGIVEWSWTVPADAPVGKWPVEVTCTSPAKKSAMVQGTMEVVRSLPN